MVLKLHGLARSTCTARVMTCLHEKGLEFELVQIDYTTRSHKQPQFLSLNPFGQFPAFEDDDFTLFESRAITKYIARKYKDVGPDLLQLGSLSESTIVDTWMEVEAQQFNGPMRELVHEILINPILGKCPNKEVIQTNVEKLEKVLDVYEERLSKCKYLACDHFSMADLHHLPYTFYFMNTDKASIINCRPNVKAWWEDISSRPAWKKTAEGMKLRERA